LALQEARRLVFIAWEAGAMAMPANKNNPTINRGMETAERILDAS